MKLVVYFFFKVYFLFFPIHLNVHNSDKLPSSYYYYYQLNQTELGPPHPSEIQENLVPAPIYFGDYESPDSALRFLMIPRSQFPQDALCFCLRPSWTLAAQDVCTAFHWNAMPAKHFVRLIFLPRIRGVAGWKHLTGHSQLSVIPAAAPPPSVSPVHSTHSSLYSGLGSSSHVGPSFQAGESWHFPNKVGSHS